MVFPRVFLRFRVRASSLDWVIGVRGDSVGDRYGTWMVIVGHGGMVMAMEMVEAYAPVTSKKEVRSSVEEKNEDQYRT